MKSTLKQKAKKNRNYQQERGEGNAQRTLGLTMAHLPKHSLEKCAINYVPELETDTQHAQSHGATNE